VNHLCRDPTSCVPQAKGFELWGLDLLLRGPLVRVEEKEGELSSQRLSKYGEHDSTRGQGRAGRHLRLASFQVQTIHNVTTNTTLQQHLR